MNVHVQASVRIYGFVSFRKIIKREWLGHRMDVCLTFCETLKLFSKIVYQPTFPASVHTYSSSSPSLLTLSMVNVLTISQSNGFAVEFYCDFNLHFSSDQ